MFAKNKVPQSLIDAVKQVTENKIESQPEMLNEAGWDKVSTPTGTKVYGSSYGDSKKARKDQTKSSVDDVKEPKKKDIESQKEETGYFTQKLLEREMTGAESRKKERIVMRMKDKQDYFKKKYGKRWKEVMYATATKQAMGEELNYVEEEEVEQIDEKDNENKRKLKSYAARLGSNFRRDNDKIRHQGLGSAVDKHIGRMVMKGEPHDDIKKYAQGSVQKNPNVSMNLQKIRSKYAKEEVEQIDEMIRLFEGPAEDTLNTIRTIRKNIPKDAKQVHMHLDKAEDHTLKGNHLRALYHSVKFYNAAKKYSMKEEVEQIDELSIGKLKQIHHAAVQSANIHDREGDTEKANKRYDLAGKASMKAQDKLRAAQKEEIELDESEPAYKDKPDHKPMSDVVNRKKTVKQIMKGSKYFGSGKVKEEVENLDEVTQADIDKSSENEVAHAKKHGWKVTKQTYGRTYKHPKHGHIDMNRYGEWQHRPETGTFRGKGNLIAHGNSVHDLDKHISSLKEDGDCVTKPQAKDIAKKEIKGHEKKMHKEEALNEITTISHEPSADKDTAVDMLRGRVQGDGKTNSFLSYKRKLEGDGIKNPEPEQIAKDSTPARKSIDAKGGGIDPVEIKQDSRYGARKEEYDLDEAKQPETDNVPFAKPYNTTSSPVVTDKSGAKHTPMSRARDLARQALKRMKKENMLGKAPGNN